MVEFKSYYTAQFKNGTNFSSYESLPKWYSKCVQSPHSLRKNRPLAAQLKSPFSLLVIHETVE